MSPDTIHGFYPGVTYQLGNLLATLNLPLQATLAQHHDYPSTLTSPLIPTLITVTTLTTISTEAKDIRFGSAPTPTRLVGTLPRI